MMVAARSGRRDVPQRAKTVSFDGRRSGDARSHVIGGGVLAFEPITIRFSRDGGDARPVQSLLFAVSCGQCRYQQTQTDSPQGCHCIRNQYGAKQHVAPPFFDCRQRGLWREMFPSRRVRGTVQPPLGCMPQFHGAVVASASPTRDSFHRSPVGPGNRQHHPWRVTDTGGLS